MAYEIHIVRQNDYNDGEEVSNISLTEWLAYVSTDPELKLTNGYAPKMPGIEVRWQDKPGLCEWHGHPQNEYEVVPWLDYGSGCISTKYPDDITIGKIINIAMQLNAKVRGDDFKYYDVNYLIEQEAKQRDLLNGIDNPWWKFW